MAQESKVDQTEAESIETKDNLLSMNQERETQVLEINKQMTSLESSVDALNKKLNSTNRQVKKDIGLLTDSDAEINEKVAATYKQLGAIEESFQTLKTESGALTKGMKSVNKNISALEKSSAKALEDAITNQTDVNDEFRSTHEEIAKRAEKLAKKVSTVGTKLNKSIKDNSKALTELEARIVTELESVAQSSEQRDEALGDQINDSNAEISAQKAKILLMQSVDEALDKRAAALESTAEGLLKDSVQLKDATKRLDVLTSKLVGDVEALEIHTAKLADQNIQQQGFIEALEEKASDLKSRLLALADLENRHFRILVGSSLALLLAIIALLGYGEYMRHQEQAATADRTAVVDNQVANLQQSVKGEQLASEGFQQEIAQLQDNLQEMQQQMQGMNDQVESLDGRVRYMAPLYNFGSDNTIHGSQWLQNLDPSQFSIKIASVTDKQELYEISQRYSYYFTQELAYFENSDGGFTLIYGGEFADESAVTGALNQLPRYMNNQRVGTISNAEVLDQITG